MTLKEKRQLKSGKAFRIDTNLLVTNSMSKLVSPMNGKQTDLGSDALNSASRLPRKEVIQPHLPVRLPCYDFTPITDPTLDACLLKRLAWRLQVLPTFVV